MGSKVAFIAQFMGKTMNYTYSFVEFEPGKRLVMQTFQGPFPMETTYEWEAAEGSSERTRMTLRNRGEPSGFGAVMAPVMVRAMRRANNKDLASIKAILEAS